MRSIENEPSDNQGQQTASVSSDAALADPFINLTIDGRYLVQSRIARGGMATVYSAVDQRLDRPVAIKIMHQHLAESTQFTARFQREARSSAKISHPGVVPVFDQGVTHGQGYLVMELVDGPNLREFLDSKGPLQLVQALSYTEEILTAVQAAHLVGVVHRDLKPENVLVAANGDLKVVDFGLARAASEVAVSTTGTIMGTIAYLAPEVAQSGQSDERTDIFSIGLMLYEMITGQVPWIGPNPINTAYSRVHEDAPPPSSVVNWIPTEIDDLIAALCARDPQERPATAAEALAMLSRVQRDLPAEILKCKAPSKMLEIPPGTPPTGTEKIQAFGKTTALPIPRQVIYTSGTIAPTQTKKARRSRWRSLVAVVLLLIVSGLAGGTWWWTQYGPGSYIKVPALTAQTQAAAQDTLNQLELVYQVDEEFSDTVPQGNVISTIPKTGERIHKNGIVEVLVSSGVKMLSVPKLVGMTQEDAEIEIASTGLAVGKVSEAWSEEVAAGIVISSEPGAEKSIRHDSQVNLVISKGREPIEVPNLIGTDTVDAEAILTESGLTSVQSEEYSNTVSKGLIIRQVPEEGFGPLYLGDSIELIVSLGPEYFEIPNVYGKQLTEAQQILEAAGFEVKINRIASFFDTVGNQSPGGGEMAIKGTLITLTVV